MCNFLFRNIKNNLAQKMNGIKNEEWKLVETFKRDW